MKDEFRNKFRNISRIIDCTGCETCKVHAKLQLLGMGTALRILLDTPEDHDLELQRNEVLV
jgi:ERO1-like protein beta